MQYCCFLPREKDRIKACADNTVPSSHPALLAHERKQPDSMAVAYSISVFPGVRFAHLDVDLGCRCQPLVIGDCQNCDVVAAHRIVVRRIWVVRGRVAIAEIPASRWISLLGWRRWLLDMGKKGIYSTCTH
jgi:hypothetical protein